MLKKTYSSQLNEEVGESARAFAFKFSLKVGFASMAVNGRHFCAIIV